MPWPFLDKEFDGYTAGAWSVLLRYYVKPVIARGLSDCPYSVSIYCTNSSFNVRYTHFGYPLARRFQ